MELTSQEIFEGAYRVLASDEVTHLKGLYGGVAQGGYCAVGALRQATFGNTLLGLTENGMAGAYAQAYTLMHRKINTPEPGIDAIPLAVTEWNDQPERTKEDVLALFRQLADEAAAGTQVAA